MAYRTTGSGEKGKSSAQARKLKARGTYWVQRSLGGVVKVQIPSFICQDPDLIDLYIDKHISDYKAGGPWNHWPKQNVNRKQVGKSMRMGFDRKE